MLKDYLEQRHITLASGRSSIALEREYWKAFVVCSLFGALIRERFN